MCWGIEYIIEVNEATDSLYSILRDVIVKYTPLAVFKRNYPCWFSADLIGLIKEKNRARRKWRRTNIESDHHTYSSLRARTKFLIGDCYNKFLIHLQDNMSRNMKLFWSFTKSKRQTNTYPNELTYNGVRSSDPLEMCQLFADYFQTTYTINPNVPTLIIDSPHVAPTEFDQINISPVMVESLLTKLDENKHGGPDGIPNVFAKRISKVLSDPLSIIFNKSIRTGQVPVNFKMAMVTPIHKKDKKSEVKNYRPVCLNNVFSMVFEKLVHEQLQQFFVGKLDVHQHGFIKKKSTLSNLSHYVDYISCNLDAGYEVHAICTDFAKAFDTVNFNILLSKLKSYGIGGTLLKWMELYLVNRHLRVAFAG